MLRCCSLGCCVLSFIGFHVQHGELAIRSIHLYMNPVFDQFPIRLSSNFNVERGQLLGYIESSNPRPNKCSLSTGSDNRAVDICNVANSEARFMR